MNAPRLPDLLDACMAVALFGATGWAAWVGAVSATRRSSFESLETGPRSQSRREEAGSVSARWCAVFVLGAWGLSTAFVALVSLGRFQMEAALPLAVGVAVVLHRTCDGRSAWRTLGYDLGAVRGVVRELLLRSRSGAAYRPRGDPRGGISRLDLALFATVAVLAFARVARGLAAPPFVTDALTYHLLRAGRWASTGGWAAERAPDAWGYYEFHPVAGDALWAWAMLPFSSDCLVGFASALTWFALALTTYATARALGAGRADSGRWAMVAATAPAAIAYMTAAYLDLATAAFSLAGTAHLARAAARGRDGSRDAFLALAALATGAAARTTLLPVLLVGTVVALRLLLARTHDRSCGGLPATSSSTGGNRLGRDRVGAVALSGLVVGAVALPGPIRALAATGSPLYPFPLNFAGRELLPGNEEMRLLYSGEMFRGLRSIPPYLEQLAELMFEWFTPSGLFSGRETLNFTPAAPAAILLGGYGFGRLVGRVRSGEPTERTRRLLVAGFLAAAIAIPLAGLLSPGLTSQRTIWAWFSGRFLLSAWATTCALGSLAGGSTGRAVSRACIAAGAAMGVPAGLPPEWLLRILPVAVGVLGMLALAGFALPGEIRRERASRVAGIALVPALVLSLALLSDWRRAHRYDFWRDWARSGGRIHEVHEVSARLIGAWPIWRAVDGDTPRVVAASAGWTVPGHNWLRYPLLGSSLQNRVIYVPPTRDGTVVDHRDAVRLAAAKDFESWLRRLREAKVDVFVAMHPEPPELPWVLARPEIFEPFARAEIGDGAAWRLLPPGPRARKGELDAERAD